MIHLSDPSQREKEILNLIVDSYIQESKPISSSYLCRKYALGVSTATVRNIMVSLERQGYLLHIYTSSGRVPTKKGFKFYVDNFNEEDASRDYLVSSDSYYKNDNSFNRTRLEDVINHTLDALTGLSGYTSLVAVSGMDERLFFRGVRLMMEQPEFENLNKLKSMLYVLEVRMSDLGSLLFDCIDERIKILIGDDIGFEEISECSLIASGLRENNLSFAFALLGPMRMNYNKAASCLCSVKNQLREVVEELV